MSAAVARAAADAAQGTAERARRRSPISSGSGPAGRPNGWSGPATSTISPTSSRDLDPAVPVLPVGVGSNLIVRDGGVPGVVVRLPKAMARSTIEPGNRVRAGGGAMGITVASKARDAGIAGLEFLRGIPGTAGGAVRMNAGAYGREVADILVEATLVLRDGADRDLAAPSGFGYTYRHSEVPEGAVVVEALFEGVPGDPAAIGAEMDRIAAEREASQPLRSRTGGSTFKNPPGTKAWKLIDDAGCRGLHDRRRASFREALQLPAQPRQGERRRHRGAGRGGAAAGAASIRRRAGMGNPAGRGDVQRSMR